MKSDFTIGIIGGNGRMGNALREFFVERGLKTIVSDKGTEISNKELVNKSDIIILAIPLNVYEQVLLDIKDNLNNSKMLMDIGSLKSKEVDLMRKYFKGEILATHPLFGPEKKFRGRENNIVVYKLNSKKKTEFVMNLFVDSNLTIIEMSPEEHDLTMAYIHGFYYLMNVTYINILKDKFKSFDKISKLTTTSFSKYISNLKENVFNTQDSLIELIAYDNPYIKEVVDKFHNSLFEKVDLKTLKGFLKNE